MDVNQEFADFIKNSELAQEFKKKQRNDLEIKRAAAIDARTPCERELEAVSTQITAAKEAYTEALKRLDEQRQKLTQETGASLLPVFSRRQELDREIKKQNDFLLTNYEKDIADAISFFRDKSQEAMTTPISRATTIGDRKHSGSTEIFVTSNIPAINNCLEHCRAAICELESMKLNSSACDVGRIEELKAGLPDVRKETTTGGWIESPSFILAALLNS